MEIEPDAPDLLNNLAVAYNQQGQEEKAYALIKEIHERFPDYSIARISLAFRMLEEHKIPRAEELLKPLLSQKHLYFTEYGLFCRSQVYLAFYKEEVEAAQYWLNMWEHNKPENPEIQDLKSRLAELQQLQSMMDDL
ncbi:hypothetical protein LKK83_25785 [Phormidium sp. CCY1219]|nr:hypothetical protein [Phormidium sp. CCY1219]